MSLEQALIDATAAMTRLTTVLVSASEAGALAAPAAPEKAPRARKAATEAPADAGAAPATTAPLVNAGDAPGTRYFHIPAHNTIYKQGPNDPDCTVAGAKIVSGAEYLTLQADYAKKFPTAAAALAQAPAPTPVATAPTATAPVATASDGPTFDDVVAKMKELHKAQQNAGVKSVLDRFGVANVPGLNGKAPNADLIAAIDSVLMGL